MCATPGFEARRRAAHDLTVSMIRSYRYRIYPTVRQAEALTAQLGFCCDLYNAALEQRIRAYEECGVSVSHFASREREAARRRDFLHKLSHRLVRDFDTISFEDLRVAKMVRGNRGLNREILDQGWSTLLHMTFYKAECAGRNVMLVPAPYTSQTCAECGVVDKRSRRVAVFRCTSCAHEDHADVNAARNINRAGLALQALTMGEEARVA